MAYIGNTQQNQNYVPAVDYFNGDGSTVAFTLSRPVASVAQVQAVIENVPQNPGSAYTVSGQTITFTSAPPSGTSNIYVYYTSPNTQINALPQSPSIVGDITTSGGHLAAGSFTSGYIDGTVVDYTSGLGRISVGASDSLVFYRGGIANTESMRINSSGWVLGGLTSSTFVYSGASTYQSHAFNANSGYDALTLTDTGGGNPTLNFAAANASSIQYRASSIRGFLSTTTAGSESGVLAFYTANAGSNIAERMRIDSSGNVGIGATPDWKFKVYDDSASTAGQVYLGRTRSVIVPGTNQSGAIYLGISPSGAGTDSTGAIETSWQDAGNPSIGIGVTRDGPRANILMNYANQTIFRAGTTEVGKFDGSTFMFNSGYGSVAKAYGCRAWVNFNGTGTIAIRGSGNVTSLSDLGNGYYGVNLTSAMPDTNYNIVTSCWLTSASNALEVSTSRPVSTSQFYVVTGDNNTDLIRDEEFVSAAIFR